MQYVPQSAGALDYAGRMGAIGAGVSLSYQGQTYADDLNVQPLGTAVLLGARFRVPTGGGAAIDVRADNLTGARYLSSIDRYGPPALLAVSVSMPIGRGESQTPACSGNNEL